MDIKSGFCYTNNKYTFNIVKLGTLINILKYHNFKLYSCKYSKNDTLYIQNSRPRFPKANSSAQRFRDEL